MAGTGTADDLFILAQSELSEESEYFFHHCLECLVHRDEEKCGNHQRWGDDLERWLFCGVSSTATIRGLRDMANVTSQQEKGPLTESNPRMLRMALDITRAGHLRNVEL